MSVIAIHRLVRRLRRSAALLVVTCVLGGAIAVAHSGMPDMHASGMAAFCLAVLPAVALLPRHRSPSAPLLRPRLLASIKPPPILAPWTRAPLARARPSAPLVLRL